MATKKITINELRSIVKQIIKEERMLKEDNLQVKNIAKQLYSFLKTNGVEVTLSAGQGIGYKKIGQVNQGMSSGKVMNNAGFISYYDDPTTKQTIIQIQLYGGPTSKDLVLGVEKKLLSAYPGLEQFDRQEVPTVTNFGLNFRVKEKTTAKGGLVGNTKQNAPQQQQPVSENLRLRNYFK